MISRKRRPTYPGVLYLRDTALEQVECFKYLGVILASDLSFPQHIDSVCSKARKILGLLYRRFYNNASKDTLLQLYLLLVRPHLVNEYASPVWNPYMQEHIKQLKDVEKFALHMATKSWDSGYQDLLSLTDIIALEPRRVQASLRMLFKIVHGLCFFPPNVITTRPNHSQRTNRQLLLQQPFAGTNAYLHSFVLHIVHAWNLLPETVVNLPLQHFKSNIVNYILLNPVHRIHYSSLLLCFLSYCLTRLKKTLKM